MHIQTLTYLHCCLSASSTCCWCRWFDLELTFLVIHTRSKKKLFNKIFYFPLLNTYTGSLDTCRCYFTHLRTLRFRLTTISGISSSDRDFESSDNWSSWKDSALLPYRFCIFRVYLRFVYLLSFNSQQTPVSLFVWRSVKFYDGGKEFNRQQFSIYI